MTTPARRPSRQTSLPELFAGWFTSRGWQPHPHQLTLLKAARQGLSTLLVAPTGGGKTLAGFLPSLLGVGGRVLAVPQSMTTSISGKRNWW
jgi:ATP-dependent Lhr-like helicase